MFVRCYLELPLPADRVEQALLGSLSEWLAAWPPAVDRVLLRRVAEATVKDFLDRVGAALTAAAVVPG
jgi:hypothetical protein